MYILLLKIVFFLERLEQSLSFIIISVVEGNLNVTINFSFILKLMIKSFEVNKLWLEENLRELQLIPWQKLWFSLRTLNLMLPKTFSVTVLNIYREELIW